MSIIDAVNAGRRINPEIGQVNGQERPHPEALGAYAVPLTNGSIVIGPTEAIQSTFTDSEARDIASRFKPQTPPPPPPTPKP